MLYKLIQWWGDEARFYACFYDSFGKRLYVPLLLAYRYWNGRLQKYKKKKKFCIFIALLHMNAVVTLRQQDKLSQE